MRFPTPWAGPVRRSIVSAISILSPRETWPRLHMERLAEIDSGRSPRIVDKMPDNYLYLGLLDILFPRATFIHCRRDLRDVAVSCWMTDFL